MSGQIGYSPWQRLKFFMAARLGSWLMRLVVFTCKVQVVNPELEQRYFRSGRPALIVTWHRCALFGLTYMGRWRPATMASLSKDGEMLSRFERMVGCVPMRGSSSRGGLQAQRGMVRYMQQGGLMAANVADGPQGPRYVAKIGMISLAQLTGLPLLPVMWSAKRVWVFKKSWDHAMIPKPFAHIKILYGREFQIPRRLSPQQMEQIRLELESELDRIRDEADRLCQRPLDN